MGFSRAERERYLREGYLLVRGLIDSETGESLSAAYNTYLGSEHHAKLEEQPPHTDINALRVEREAVIKLWQRTLEPGQDDQKHVP